MKRAFTLILLAFATAAHFIGGPVKNTKTKPATSAAKIAHKSPLASAAHSSTHAVSNTANPSTAKARYVRARNGKLVRVASRKTSSAPSYQLHPEPERYQQIQQALADKGYFKGEVNGQWGEDSVDALKRFQADQKLDPDGHLNALTLIGLGLGPKHDSDVGHSDVGHSDVAH